MKLVFQDSLIFQIWYFFTVFMPLLWQTPIFWKILYLFWNSGKFLWRREPLPQKKVFFVAVNHCNEGNSYVAVTHCNKGKCLLSQWSKATKGNYYVVVNQCANRKFLCRCEPPRWRKIPMLQWTTMTKKNLFTNAVKHCKEGKTNLFWTKHKFWIKRVLWHKMGIKTKKNV